MSSNVEIRHGMFTASLAVTPCMLFNFCHRSNKIYIANGNSVAMMARLVAGVRNQSVILTLPGSPKGAKENLESVVNLLPHACVQAAGTDSRKLHSGGIAALEQQAGVQQVAVELNKHDKKRGHQHCHLDDQITPVPHTIAQAPRSYNPEEGPTKRHRASPYPMISVDEALQLIAQRAPVPQVIDMQIDEKLVGAVLAEDVTATEAVPAFRASIVDGYAMVISNETPATKGVFPVVSIMHAAPGEVPHLKTGQVARITTGAPIPSGATAVIMVEDTTLHDVTGDGKEEAMVAILTDQIKPGENVREVGSDIAMGDIILRKGDELTAIGGELGLLASVGKHQVSVYARPKVGVLSSGDEIVGHRRPGPLRSGEVRDCNRLALMAALENLGYKVIDLGIARDR